MGGFHRLRYLLLLLTLALCSDPLLALAQSRREERRAERRGGRSRKKQKKQRLAVLNPDALPIAYTPVWRYSTDDAMRLPALPDAQQEAVYLPLGSGAVVALNSRTGELKWEAQPAGKIVAALESANELLLVASRKGGERGGLLRALERATGLTRWVKDYDSVFSSPLTVHFSIIYVAAEDGQLRAIRVEDGQSLWSVDLGAVSKARIVVDGEEVFLGSESGLLHCLRLDGGQKWKFQARDAVRGAVTVNSRMVYFGDSSGYVYALERSSGKLVWRVRTGAAVETAPKLIDDLLYVASFDNFVYAYDAGTGDRRWLVNTLGRLSYDMITERDGLLLAPQSSSRLYTLSLRGRLTGRYDLLEGSLIAPVAMSGRSIFLVTDLGLHVAEQVSYNSSSEERGGKGR